MPGMNENAKQKRHRAGGCNHGGFGVGKAVLRENIRLGHGKGVDAQSAADQQHQRTAQTDCSGAMQASHGASPDFGFFTEISQLYR